MIPSFIEREFDGLCTFYFNGPQGYVLDLSDFIIGDLEPKDKTLSRGMRNGVVAIEMTDGWRAERVNIYPSPRAATFECSEDKLGLRMAFPVDPNMTEKDVNGATILYPNETNDGWLFAHATPAHHDDRIITLEAVMRTLFEGLIHDQLEDVLKAVIGHNNPSPKIGTELLYTYNAQSGEFTNYSNIIEFRKECVKWCSEVEKRLHIGQHVQEDNHTLKHQLVRAIHQAKAVWKADTEGKARNLEAIEGQVNAIIAHVERDHAFETRWARAARREAEAKAAKARSDAANSETETTPSE